MMRFIHFLSDRFIVASFQCITNIEHTLNFFNHIFSTHIILFRDLGFHLIQHLHVAISQILYMRMNLLHGSNDIFTALTAFVVGRRSQLMFHYRVNQNQTVAIRFKREILIFQRTAVQTDQMAFLAEYRSKLIHNATVYTTIVMLCSLSHLSQFKFINLIVTEQIVQGISISRFQSGRRRHSRTQRHITGECCIESLHIYSALDHFTAHAKDVACPACVGSVFLIQSELNIILQVD